MKTYHLILLTITLSSCTIFYSKQDRKLLEFDGDLPKHSFPNSDQCEKIWSNGKNEAMLQAIICSNKTSKKGKFVAASVLLKYRKLITKTSLYRVAKIYADLLKYSGRFNSPVIYSLTGFHWGVLYDRDYINGQITSYSYAGGAGEQLIQIGKPAIPPLIRLLRDNHANFAYEGSECTSNMDYQYRVKDFAAFFLSEITKVPWKFYLDKKKRDIEMERFKKELFKQLAKEKK